MAAVLYFRLLLYVSAIFTTGFATSDQPVCPSQSSFYLRSLESQCPIGVPLSSPSEVDGKSLEKVLDTQWSSYTSILFYASWCPFSEHARSTIDIISSMFPQINHIAVEESNVMPIMFSKYGIHSIPSIILVNKTSRFRHHGLKSPDSVVAFYKTITGYEPVVYLSNNRPMHFYMERSMPWKGPPLHILKKEPYLVFSLIFLCLRGFLYFFPGILSHMMAVWFLCIRHVTLGVLGETSQLLEQVGHVMDLKRAWSRLKLCKARKLQNGAKNARVWASSLASVSLSEPSSSRSCTVE